MNGCDISVIIPVFREEGLINETVDALYGLAFDGRLEIIVADGDPEESTLKAIRDPRVRKICSEKGRGKQINTGARLASGEVLLFLHADTELPPDGFTRINTVMREEGCMGGSFELGIASDRRCFRLIEKAASIRSRADENAIRRSGHFSEEGLLSRSRRIPGTTTHGGCGSHAPRAAVRGKDSHHRRQG